MNFPILLAFTCIFSVIFLTLLTLLFILRRRSLVDPSDVKQQVAFLKISSIEFGIPYSELEFGKLLGKGSQGEVYRARWRGSDVAVKKIDTRSVPPEIIEEFCSEAEIMKRLRHPALTLFMGVSLEHPHLCIISEIVSRGSLFDLIHDETSPLTWSKCLIIASDVARGMTYLHGHKPPVLHRDLKSLNILIDENWRGKVADFGMSKNLVEQETMTQCGSPLWMSPEMIRNDIYTEKADVYSFAICLWELYTRKIPYRDLGLQPSHLVVKVVKENLRPPIPKTMPKPYAKLMGRCWHPQPEKRPTFEQILKVLEGFCSDPVLMNHKPLSSREPQLIVRVNNGENLIQTIEIQKQQLLFLNQSHSQWKISESDIEFLSIDNSEFSSINKIHFSHYEGTKASKIVDSTLLSPKSSPNNAFSQTSRTDDYSLLANLNEEQDFKKGLKPRNSHSQSKTKVGSGIGKGLKKRTGGGGNKIAPTPPTPTEFEPIVTTTLNEDLKLRMAKQDELTEIITQTHNQKNEEPLHINQGNKTVPALFRGKVVTVKKCPLKGELLHMTDVERVQADLAAEGESAEAKLDSLMKLSANLRHPNLLLFIGAYISTYNNNDLRESPHIGVLFEFMSHGVLSNLLSDSKLALTWDTQLQLLIDAAQALVYLHSYKPKPIIHDSLSTNSCVVDRNWRLKLKDYIFNNLEFKIENRPEESTVWDAPEVILEPSAKSTYSNCYSFGSIMYSMLTRKTPFEGLEFNDLLKKKITSKNERPQLSESMQPEFRQLIEKCWSTAPVDRPSAIEILQTLLKISQTGPPKLVLVKGLNSFEYRKRLTVYAYRSKDPVTVHKDWGINIGKRGDIVIFSGEDDVYVTDRDTFNSSYEKIKSSTGVETNEYRKTGRILARCMEESFAIKSSSPSSTTQTSLSTASSSIITTVESGQAGDYLVQNEQMEQWVIEANTFKQLYEKCD